MIRLENLTVSFGGVTALDALDVELTAPVVGLIGPNGAGKTTLLNVMSGFVTPRGGDVFLAGQRLTHLRPADRARLGLRRTFQQEQVVEELTVWENVQAIADHLADPRRGRAEIARAIGRVGLSGKERMPGAHLNLLERRLVELAKTLVGGPKAILLDEPGAGLDEIESRRLYTLLKDIPGELGAQMVVIDHDAEMISSFCEQTVVLDFGRLLACGPTKAVLNDEAVRRAYLGSASS
ncbi:MAG: ATP-binding cassette domain-containing protein [Xanthobacteraceae bacterium]|nr:ATP-binding cassette domain-containing protein [Xanthobacteraceae bacterium]